MGNENVIDLASPDLVFGHLHLCAFAAIHKEYMLIHRHYLGSRVPVERRQEIFKPYFTTHQKGTGLGLAIVSQIVLAHGWEIQCLANAPKGAIFRITHLKLAV